MTEETVANQEVSTAPVETSTPPETAQVATTESTPKAQPTENVAKQAPANDETTSRFDKHPRFQQLQKQRNEALAQLAEIRRQNEEMRSNGVAKANTTYGDPLANLSPEERAQADAFIDRYVVPKLMPQFEQQYGSIVKKMVTDKQIEEAKSFSSKVGIDFDDRLPELVQYLSMPENKGRLTAKEAFTTLYAEEIADSLLNKGKSQASEESRILMEKKKLANTALPSVNQNAVIHSDEMARRTMSSGERLQADIQWAIQQGKANVRHPNVRVD